MKRFLLPLGIFLALAIFLALGLKLDPREVPSPLIDKPAPAFALPALSDPARNVWASWCGACREEHPVLVEFARRQVMPIYGLNYKDERPAGLAWLQAGGNPYVDSLFDHDGLIGIDYGVYGVPETFIIDKAGVIRYKHTGPITPQVLQDKIEPLLRRLNV